MKLLTPFAAIIAAAAAGQIYSSQPAEAYAHSAEVYQSALEYQQQGLYSDQSHAYSGHSAGDQHAYTGQEGHEQAYSGHSRPEGEKTARILSFMSGNDGHGYQYSYETENGIKAQESGQIAGHEKGTEAHGAYSYKGDDGQVYTVTYTADEHGFHPQGAHLPTPPPIPEAIAKGLEQNAKDEANGIFDDGKYSEQHESQQEHPIEPQEHGSSGHQQNQAFVYETAVQHEFQPSHQTGHQQSYQLEGHQPGGHQQSYQLGGHQSSGHQQSYQLGGHQSGGHQQNYQLGGHQESYELRRQSGGHEDHQSAYKGHQPAGFQLSAHQQGHQLGGFRPSYHAMNVPVESYRKH